MTKVGRGQKLGDNHEAVPFSDMTVEDLLRIVRSLPPEESAVAAVSRGLFYLDSRALAALLKELHKVGLSNRCGLAALANGNRQHFYIHVSAFRFPSQIKSCAWTLTCYYSYTGCSTQ